MAVSDNAIGFAVLAVFIWALFGSCVYYASGFRGKEEHKKQEWENTERKGWIAGAVACGVFGLLFSYFAYGEYKNP